MSHEEVLEESQVGLPIEAPSEPTLEILRHSAAHLLAKAVVELYPGTKYDVGPPIEDGFFYNFMLPGEKTLAEAELQAIEDRMHALAKEKIPFEKSVMGRQEARGVFEKLGQDYKVSLIDRMPPEVDTVGIYKTGPDYIDLCRGPHVPDTGWLKHVKLMRVAGVYWRGDEKNDQLQRVYGTAWFTKDELYQYLQRLEEAERRDHRKIGKEMELFHFDETAPGMTYWLPNGLTMINELMAFSRAMQSEAGYQEIATPLINNKKLWEISGHWDHYRDNMFLIEIDEETTYGVKPMNCPNAMVTYNLKTHSYRDLPLRLSDFSVLHRYERAGTLHGLMRARKFQQDDAHIFVREDQIEEEYSRVLGLAKTFYEAFGIKYSLKLATRPDHFLGEAATWDQAEAALRRVLDRQVGEGQYEIDEGGGAFYGPKIDIFMEDAIGRSWQTGTVQLDYQIPSRFGCVYVDTDGAEKQPVVIHRAIYGSIERFLGVLVEHFEGRFPLWFAPVQLEVIPVQDDSQEVLDFIQDLVKKARAAGIRAIFNDKPGERMQGRVRDAEMMKVPYVVVVGKRDLERGDGVVNVRNTRTHTQVDLPAQELIEKLAEEASSRSVTSKL